MPTKFFKMTWNSSINITEDNLSTMLQEWFCEDIQVKELLKTPKITLDIVKKIKRVKSG